MNNALMDEQFELLRAKIETAVETPAVILISSACVSDGKSVTAYGLATSFSGSGYSTVLIDANHLAPTVSEDHAPISLEQFAASGPPNFARSANDVKFGAISLVKETIRRNVSRPMVSRAVEACRQAYDVVIIDAAPLGDSHISMMLANQADGIVLTVREGRGIKRADHDLIKVLDATDLPVLGTVTIEAKMISAFKTSAVERRRAAVRTISSVESAARARTAVG